MQTILSVKNLRKIFGNFTAVDNISFTVAEGEVVGLLGPNGAGKSTTIFMLLNIITPTSGGIEVFGKTYETDKQYILQHLNYSSTYVEMAPRLTVKENLEVMARLYQIPDFRTRIPELEQKFGVAEFDSWLTEKLSAGQKTRVSLVKAFLNDPKLLLLDEPTASLDPDIAAFVRKEILTLKEQGKTVLITSHNMAEVEEVCDRVLFINYGKIIAEDTPLELAKKVRQIRVNFMMKDGQKRTLAFADKAGFGATSEGRYVTIEVNEDDIAYLLASLADLGVEYSQVSIDKPSLNDYFIKMAQEEHK